jgi:hypothetical protein
MALKPSELAQSYSQSGVLPFSEFATCKRCFNNFLPGISLHPSICCIKKHPDYSAAATNFYTRDHRKDIENFPGYWLSYAISTTKRIELYSVMGRDGARDMSVLVDFLEEIPFDKLHAMTRAKACMVDSIPAAGMRFRRLARQKMIGIVLAASKHFSNIPLEIVRIIADA